MIMYPFDQSKLTEHLLCTKLMLSVRDWDQVVSKTGSMPGPVEQKWVQILNTCWSRGFEGVSKTSHQFLF